MWQCLFVAAIAMIEIDSLNSFGIANLEYLDYCNFSTESLQSQSCCSCSHLVELISLSCGYPSISITLVCSCCFELKKTKNYCCYAMLAVKIQKKENS